MTQNQIEIGCDRYGTTNPNKKSSKAVTSRKLDFPLRLYAKKYANHATWNLQVKNPEHRHDATDNIMEHPAFRKLNEQETSQISKCLNNCFFQGKFSPNYAARGSLTGL
ncbi:hypothetical protein O181_105110 [Austropuccinia psidii MF-1]|uniref:Uncharacterized protein n=1 Tax=Austropuccinia psidii MF-1 TaxID=1389203 RepID=A0A9Q3JL32_9BASI|nr:hypothetical protein [Austropuccinia psidii MF-1]